MRRIRMRRTTSAYNRLNRLYSASEVFAGRCAGRGASARAVPELTGIGLARAEAACENPSQHRIRNRSRYVRDGDGGVGIAQV